MMEAGQPVIESGALIFPDMDIKTLIPKYIDRSWHVGSSVVLREFEDFLRNPSELDSSV